MLRVECGADCNVADGSRTVVLPTPAPHSLAEPRASATLFAPANLPGTVARVWRRFTNGAAAFVLPQDCLLCAGPSARTLICEGCARTLPRNESPCPTCGLPLSASERSCRRCQAAPPAFDSTIAPYLYAYPLDRLVQAFKYQGQLGCARWFAESILAGGAAAAGADLIVAMPLARARQRERGFNQSLEIARVISRRTGVPLAVNAVRRVRDTRPQAGLPWVERRRNVHGAFTCSTDLGGRHVTVVDDVMTTGASLDELSRTLKHAGAARVANWVVARTPLPDDCH
jgi:ComF family protein